MARRLPARVNLKDQVKRNQAWAAFASPDGKAPPLPASIAHLGQPKRVQAPRDPSAEYESGIQRDIIAMLRAHPKVASVERHNSGTAMEMDSDGNKRFVKYNTVYKVRGVRMRKVDIDCTLINGKRFVCEVKKPPWARPRDQREYEQENYINHVRQATGYGLFATSVLEVDAALAAIQI